MQFLTVDNTLCDTDALPELITEGVPDRFCVLDYSNVEDVDFRFPALVFLDEFTRQSAVLSVGRYRVTVPMDWSIVVGDVNSGELEIVEIKDIGNRGFTAFCYNPITGYIPSFLDLRLVGQAGDLPWTVPKLVKTHLLALPIQSGPSPLCVLIVKDMSKLPDSLDIGAIFG